MTQPPLLRRHAMALALLALAGLPAAAQDYPNKPIKLVIPFPAGGSSDGIGRQIADKLGGVLKQSIVVENKGGAGGMIGTDAVAKSAPDGYTLVLVDVFHTSTPVYTRKMPYDAVKDFTPISLIGRSPAFLVASPAFEPKTGRDAVAFAKAQPGKMSMAIAGTGSVVVDLFRARSGLQFVSVPYRGSSPALIDLMSGQVNVMITTMASAGTQVKAGKSPAEVVDDLFLRCFSRRPTVAERSDLDRALAEAGDAKQQALEDIFWALLNSKEFMFNH